MNNFEKRKIYQYLIISLETYSFGAISAGRDLFYELKKEFKSGEKFDYSEMIRDYKKEDLFVETIINKAKARLNQLKSKETKLENKCIFIKNIYDLNKAEYEFFVCFAIHLINSISKYLYPNINLVFEEIGKNLLKLNALGIERAKNSLLKKGVFIQKYKARGEVIIDLNPRIIEIVENSSIKTEKRIKNILLGKNQKAELNWNDFTHLKAEREIVSNILSSALKNKTKGINILLYGSVGTGKTQFAKMIANTAGVEQYAVLSTVGNKEATREDRLNDLCSKQSILSKTKNSCILFDEAEDVMNRGFSEFGKASKAYMNDLLENASVPVFWTTNNIYSVDPAFLRRMTYSIEFEKLDEIARLNIWKRTIRKNKFKVDNKKLAELNKTYDIPPALIANAVKTTKLIGGTEDDFETFVENISQVVYKKKGVKKQKEFEMKGYDINLINTDLDIKNLTDKIKTCGKLNFSLCLYGEPGTGKSLYARYLANELGVDVILKRASDLMSKYVGETEQNIAEAFAQAKSKGAMLIFDEADSFLQNRNNAVRNWEISQVNEMLTWMESHQYPFVCTTNLIDTLDEASLRRFTFKIKFDFLTNEQVNCGFEYFFGIQDANMNIKGLTAGDFATVKKKADFLNITDTQELTKMLLEEVKIKKSKELKNAIGF